MNGISPIQHITGVCFSFLASLIEFISKSITTGKHKCRNESLYR
jgi:hypothetical protein